MQPRHAIFACLLCAVSVWSSVNAEQCDADKAWLPKTPALVSNSAPPPHPASDCPFYQAAWQTFLIVSQPAEDGTPEFLSTYSSIEDLFGAAVAANFPTTKAKMLSLAPRNLQRPNEKSPPEKLSPAVLTGGVNQAGPLRGLLIDQHGNPIFYAIHVNGVYSKFIADHGLKTKSALLSADPNLEFPTGAVELKSAWQIVEPGMDVSNYFTTKALVPVLKIENGDVIDSTTSREVTVALLAIHVVFVLKDHPEFIWATFEHLGSGGKGARDNAPAAPANPANVASSTVVSTTDWALYKAGTPAGLANIPNSAQDRINSFDENSQKFAKGARILQTSVYRAYPGSDSSSTDEDDAIVALNASVRKLFAANVMPATDKRKNYQLVGALWLDNPGRDFQTNVLFQNQPGQTTDTPGAMVAGEDRLSSTAMESFTQAEGQFPNCFQCHNTKRVTNDFGRPLVGAKRLNVSHVISKYLSEAP